MIYLILVFFRKIHEHKGKPSVFLYKLIKDLAKLLNVHNQPINRLMDWKYYEMKYKEVLKGDSYKSENSLSFILFGSDTEDLHNQLSESDKELVKDNLQYLQTIDELRAKLIFFIIWDIEEFYETKDYNYNWNYWILPYNTILDVFNFTIKWRLDMTLILIRYLENVKLITSNKYLKFYDPEENLEKIF